MENLIGENYNSKECAILAGYSVCLGISNAFADISNRMGIDCEVVSNSVHSFNMIYTTDGPRFIDVAMAVNHFQGNDFNTEETYKMPCINNEPFRCFLQGQKELPQGYPHNIGDPNRGNREL